MEKEREREACLPSYHVKQSKEEEAVAEDRDDVAERSFRFAGIRICCDAR
jgi:hypothetical protein